MLLQQQCPEFDERLRQAHERVLARGVVPKWEHVKEPFDYDRRQLAVVAPTTRRIRARCRPLSHFRTFAPLPAWTWFST